MSKRLRHSCNLPNSVIIYLGADHRGFDLKELIKKQLTDEGHAVEDLGAPSRMPDDDYPDYAGAVAAKVSEDPQGRRGIVVCGSGFGVDIVANKFAGVRSALAVSAEHIREGRHDDDVNVLALAADFVNRNDVPAIVETFLSAPFDDKDERFARRIAKTGEIEKGK